MVCRDPRLITEGLQGPKFTKSGSANYQLGEFSGQRLLTHGVQGPKITNSGSSRAQDYKLRECRGPRLLFITGNAKLIANSGSAGKITSSGSAGTQDY